MKKSEKAMGVLIGFIYVVLAGGWIASGIHYKSFALMLMQTSKIGIVYYVLPPVAIVFLATDVLDIGAVELDGDVFCGAALAQNPVDHCDHGAIANRVFVWLVSGQRLCCA